MITYARLKPSGCIASIRISRTPPPDHIALPDGMGAECQSVLMRVAGEWVARPRLPEWTRAGGTIAIPDCPDGVVIEVHDAKSGAFFGRSDDGSVTLPDPGAYRIDIYAPDPWVSPPPFTVEI